MGKMQKIAFLTMDSLEGFVSYDSLVRDLLVQRHILVDEIPWRARDVNWDQYRLVIIRSPWDYQTAFDEFLTVLKTIDASQACLMNSLKIVHWNIRKTYLQRLDEAGVTTVPTQWLTSPTIAELKQLPEKFGTEEFIVKPIIGANSDDTFRLRADASMEVFQSVERIFQKRIVLAQPFVSSVTEYGELSLIFFNHQYSHCILKTPKPGDFRVQEEHGGQIRSTRPDREIIDFAAQTLTVVPSRTLYARADVVFLADDRPAIMELELIEPSLYLSNDAKSPGRFADAIEAELQNIEDQPRHSKPAAVN